MVLYMYCSVEGVSLIQLGSGRLHLLTHAIHFSVCLLPDGIHDLRLIFFPCYLPMSLVFVAAVIGTDYSHSFFWVSDTVTSPIGAGWPLFATSYLVPLQPAVHVLSTVSLFVAIA